MEVTTRVAPVPSAGGAFASPPALPSGQAVAARVQQIIAEGVFRLATASGPIDVRSPTPLPVGSAVTLFITPGTGEVRVTLSGGQDRPGQSAPSAASTSNAAPSTGSPALTASTTTMARPEGAIAGQRPAAPVLTGDGVARPVPSVVGGGGALTTATADRPGVASATPPPSTPTASVASGGAAPGGPMFAMIAAALTRQDSLAPLLANLAALTDRRRDLVPDTVRNNALPETVRAAAARVAQFILPGETALTPEAMQRAIENSGTLFERALASGTATRPQVLDLKGALLLFRDALQSMLAAEDGSALPPKGQAETNARPPPPRRGDVPEPQKAAMPSLPPNVAPLDVARTLLDQTEAALARLRLAQAASIGGEREPGIARLDGSPQQLHMEIPFAIGRGVVTMPIVIERDAEGTSAEALAPVWRVWFAIDAEPAGPITGLVTLGGRDGAIGVTLWAERDATQRALQESLPALRRALEAEDLAFADLGTRSGSPHRSGRPAGRFLDTRT